MKGKKHRDTAETLLPQCETIVVHRIATFLRVSAQHIRHLIEAGEIVVPSKELARVTSKEKPYTMVSVPRESLVEFIAPRLLRPPRKTERPLRPAGKTNYGKNATSAATNRKRK
jgi:hypothetical protein